MLKQHESEDERTSGIYAPVPRRDEMSDMQIEDFLDRCFAPIIGTVSYEERRERRDEMRRQILSTVAAHVELGSTRAQAIALTLQSLPMPAVTTLNSAPRSTIAHSDRTGVRAAGSLKTALAAFGLTSLALVLGAIIDGAAPGATHWLMLLVFVLGPLAAGMFLGAKAGKRPIASMLLAQLLLYAPTTLAVSLVLPVQGISGGFPMIAFRCLEMSIVTASIGAAGIPVGRWLKDRFGKQRSGR